jgi:hypothetical protein
MRTKNYTILILAFATLLTSCKTENKKETNDDNSELNSVYLRQKPPGLIPEPFAPGIITTKGFEDGGVFSPDMNEFHYIRLNKENKLESVIHKRENNEWVKSISKDSLPFYPFFSIDDKTIYFGKRYIERTDSGWSELKSLGSLFEEIEIMSLSVSSKGTFAIDERRPEDDGILRYSRLVDGKREAPKPFGKEINSGIRNSHPFIAPDESYVIWDGIKDNGFGDVDLYISFRQQDGAYGPAINMGDKINTERYEAGPKVTPDGKYLFFVRNMGSDKFENIDIFWVDAKIIETLKPKH